MESARVNAVDVRSSQRISIAQGLIQARLRIPANWNWFTNVNSVDVLNVSHAGIGVTCRVPLEQHVELFFKDSTNKLFSFHGEIKHLQTSSNGVYHGIELCHGQNQILPVFAKLLPSTDQIQLAVIS